MRRKAGNIPVNNFGGPLNERIVVERLAFSDLPELSEWSQPERHDRHSFFLVEEGTVTLEIDFQLYVVEAPVIIYMHPNQVHRVMGFENVTVSAWAIHSEDLQPEYLRKLEDIMPAKPLGLDAEGFSLLRETVNLCLRFTRLGNAALQTQCNALVGLAIFLFGYSPSATLTRFDQVAKAFREALEHHYKEFKRPGDYAAKLNLSEPYLNECVRNATGLSVSRHIQQRVILEAKRLLFHSALSLKEVATTLGYEDYAYFSRLFTRVTGLSPTDFRTKNHDSSKSSFI